MRKYCEIIMLQALLITSLIGGCGNTSKTKLYSFDNSKPPNYNYPLPRDFQERTIYKDSASVRDNLPDLIGKIVELNTATGTARQGLERYVKSDKTPQLRPIEANSGKIYYSKVNQQFKVSAKASYLATLSFDIGIDEMLEIIIQDTAIVKADSKDFDRVKLRQLKRENYDFNKFEYCLVNNVRVSTINYKRYSKLNNINNIAYGDSFAVNGEVYSSNEGFSSDFRVSLGCIPVEEIIKNMERKHFSGSDVDEMLEEVLENSDKFRMKQGTIITNISP